MNTIWQEKIDAFVKKADEIVADYFKRSGYSLAPPTHRADQISDKWVRVVTVEERNGKPEDSSVYAFICLQNYTTKTLGNLMAGDIHKPATFKAPAKHARGSIFNPDFAKCMTPFGIVYLN